MALCSFCGQKVWQQKMLTTNSGGYSIDGDPPVCSDDVFDALQRCRRGDLHRPTGSMFVFDTRPPFRELLHPIMDCLM
jgi:hypothetical protein